MKYISLDLETTDLDPKHGQVIQCAMVLEDTDHPDVPVEELPFFNCFVWPNQIVGSPYAIRMHANNGLWNRIHELWKQQEESEEAEDWPPLEMSSFVMAVSHEEYLWSKVLLWLEHFGFFNEASKRANMAGKNAGVFDYQWMPKRAQNYFRHRIIDPGSVFVDWSQKKLPDLKALTNGEVAHDALEDARDVIRVLRKSYR